MEDEQRVVQQQQLIADLWSHRSHHCHAFTTPHDAVSQIATALLGMARTDFAAPASSYRHTHVQLQRAHTPPFGTCHVQAALRDSIALDPPLLPSQVGRVLLLTHSNSLIYLLIYPLTHSTHTIALDPPLLPSHVGRVLLLTHSNSLIYSLIYPLTHSTHAIALDLLPLPSQVGHVLLLTHPKTLMYSLIYPLTLPTHSTD